MGSGHSQVTGIFSCWRQWAALMNVGHRETMAQFGGSAEVVAVPSSSPPAISLVLQAPNWASPQARPPRSRGQRGISPALALPLPLPVATVPCQTTWVPLCRAAPGQWVPVTPFPRRLWLQPWPWLGLGRSSPKALVPMKCPFNALVLDPGQRCP